MRRRPADPCDFVCELLRVWLTWVAAVVMVWSAFVSISAVVLLISLAFGAGNFSTVEPHAEAMPAVDYCATEWLVPEPVGD